MKQMQDSLPDSQWFRQFLGTDTRLRFQFRGSFFPLDGTVVGVTDNEVAIQKRLATPPHWVGIGPINKAFSVEVLPPCRVDIGPKTKLVSVDVLP